jgi:hypothetical protein
MKKVTLLLCVLFLAVFVNAQSAKEEIELMQAAFGMEKKAMVAEFVSVDPAQKDAFWNLYDEYETSRKELGQKRIELYNQYVEKFDKMDNVTAESWTKEILDLKKKTDALINSYYAKIKKVTNPVVALQFYMIEEYILTGIRFSVLDELPFPEMK